MQVKARLLWLFVFTCFLVSYRLYQLSRDLILIDWRSAQNSLRNPLFLANPAYFAALEIVQGVYAYEGEGPLGLIARIWVEGT